MIGRIGAVERAANGRGAVALVMGDAFAAEFYIELLHDYNAGREPRDEGVWEDEQSLREQYELLWGDEGDWGGGG